RLDSRVDARAHAGEMQLAVEQVEDLRLCGRGDGDVRGARDVGIAEGALRRPEALDDLPLRGQVDGRRRRARGRGGRDRDGERRRERCDGKGTTQDGGTLVGAPAGDLHDTWNRVVVRSEEPHTLE